MNEINFEIKDVEKIDLSMDVGVKEIFPPIENLEVTPTKEQQVFNHENSYGYDNVTVNPIPDEYIIPDGTLDVASNGDVDVTMFRMARVGVYTPPALQDKSITITENGTQSITFDEGYDGLNSVEVTANIVGAISEFVTDCSNLFDNNSYAKPYLVNKFLPYCKPVTAYKMFNNNSSLSDGTSTKVDLSLMDMSDCENCEGMFEGTSSSQFIFGTNFNTSKVKNMKSMFSRFSANTLDLSFLDTSSVTNMNGFLYNVRNLKTLDISNCDFSKVTNSSGIFQYVGANLSTPTTVYVKDEKAQQFILSLPATGSRPSNWTTENVVIKS